MTTIKTIGAAAALALLGNACGGAPIPEAKMTDGKAAIRGAEEAGAERVPEAALHLKMARDQVATAERLIEEDENEEAAMVLDRARMDAELAIAKTRVAHVQRDAQRALHRVQELQSQLNAGGGG